ncbi:MAG: hypothetical protein WDN49_00775 [Acetobacteraceae bacterium]
MRRLPVLREPHHMALSPDGHSLLVGDTSGNSIFFLDPRNGRDAEAPADRGSLPAHGQPGRQVADGDRPRP